MNAWTIIVTVDATREQAAAIAADLRDRLRNDGHPEVTTVTVETWMYQERLRPTERTNTKQR